MISREKQYCSDSCCSSAANSKTQIRHNTSGSMESIWLDSEIKERNKCSTCRSQSDGSSIGWFSRKRGYIYKKVTGDIIKENQSEDSPEKDNERVTKILEKLDLEDIESWTEQQQCSVRKLLEVYQPLFALNLKELGKTSLVQHEIKLSDKTPFKEWYRRIPPHQYEEVRKHLQEMLDIGAICRSTSPWASPVVLVHKKDGSLVLY